MLRNHNADPSASPFPVTRKGLVRYLAQTGRQAPKQLELPIRAQSRHVFPNRPDRDRCHLAQRHLREVHIVA